MSAAPISATASNLPIGTVVAYAGDLTAISNLTALNQAGWYLCDGTAYDRTQFAALFAAIGTANGGAGNTFNVPDLRSRFLRGTSGNAVNIDPDAAGRVAAATGGATGNNTGSLQASATALPVTAQWLLASDGMHMHACLHLNPNMREVWDGSSYSMARWSGNTQVDNAGAHFHSLTGFDSSTSPINVALYFIIKASDPQNPTGTIPSGAIVAFAGPLSASPAKWLECNGAAYSVTLYPNLRNTIVCNFGGDGVKVLNVPDLRGYFLRGTSHQSGRDPDAARRHALNTGGRTGDNIGSAQPAATGTPSALAVVVGGDHTHNIALVPQTDQCASPGAGPLAHNCMAWTDAPTESSPNGDHNHTLTGGDKETRPQNIYADFLIASDDLPQSAPPIGTIMTFGGDITDPNVAAQIASAGWLPCDGSSLDISAYQKLYAVIGTTFGSAPLKFSLPDLRGYFVVGAGTIPLATKQTASTTGAPITAFVTTTDGDHAHTMYNIPTDTHDVEGVGDVDLAENNPNESPTSTAGAHAHALSGGDAESRGVNVNVDYIIRFQ